MTDTTLGKDQAIALLQKLSTDDAFRAAYEASPATALEAAGLPTEMVRSLPPENLIPGKLLAKEAFAKSLEQVRADIANVYLCLHPPTVRLQSSDGARASTTAVSFLKQ